MEYKGCYREKIANDVSSRSFFEMTSATFGVFIN